MAATFVAVALLTSLLPIAAANGIVRGDADDFDGWAIAGILLLGVFPAIWVGFCLKHARGASRAGATVTNAGVSIRNISSRHNFALDEVHGFVNAASSYSYFDEIYITALILTLWSGEGLPDNSNVPGVILKLRNGDEIAIWSLMDNTDDPMWPLRRQRGDFDWESIAADLNKQLDRSRASATEN